MTLPHLHMKHIMQVALGVFAKAIFNLDKIRLQPDALIHI